MNVEKYFGLNDRDFWFEFEDGVEVYPQTNDCTMSVYLKDKYLGSIIAADRDDFDGLLDDLENGSNPVVDGWEDGIGNSCSYDGWGDATEEEEE